MGIINLINTVFFYPNRIYFKIVDCKDLNATNTTDIEQHCRDFLQEKGIDAANYEHLTAVTMQGYEELTGYGDSLLP